MTGSLKFNNIDVFDTFGMCLRKGADNQLLQFSKRKSGYENNWPDENGIETDPGESPVFERLIYNLPVLMIATGKGDFFTKYDALRSFLLTAKEFNMDIAHLPRRFKVRYSDMTGFDKLTTFSQEGTIGCFFNLVLTDDYPTQKIPIV